jgi:hypothetical protein
MPVKGVVELEFGVLVVPERILERTISRERLR